MIYLEKTAASQLAYIPRTLGSPKQGESLVLVLTDTVENVERVRAEVLDLAIFRLYHRVAVQLPENAAEWEYRYSLRGTDGLSYADGLAVVGHPGGAYQETNKIIEYEQRKD